MALMKSLAQPVVWILACLILGLILGLRQGQQRRREVGRWLIVLGTLLLLTLSLGPTAHLLAYSLECRYAPASVDALETLDVVVVLGGGTRALGGLRSETELSGRSYSRAYQGVPSGFGAKNPELLLPPPPTLSFTGPVMRL